MIDFHCDNCEFLQDKSNDNIIDGYCKKYNQSLTFYDWFEKCDKCLIETLQSENAALRERLEKAMELPLKVGSTVYIIHETDEEDKFNPWIDTGRIVTFSFDVELWIFVRYNSGLTMWYSKDTFDKEVCLTLEAAETRLAELKGEKE